MKVLVGVKRVVDAYVKIRVKSDQTGIEMANLKMSMIIIVSAAHGHLLNLSTPLL